jgi:large subunit ribosomal protein L22
MGKPKHPRALANTEAKAVAKNIKTSAQKLNLVAGMIRGKKVQAAIADLEFSRKRVAEHVRKAVISAVANAENNHGLDVDDLIVAEAYVGKNMILKRFHARGRGRSASVMRPFSQLTVVVRQVEPEEKPAKKKAKPATQASVKSSEKSKPAKSAAAKEAV